MKSKNFIFGAVLPFMLIAAVGCENSFKIKGNHDVGRETRQMVSFESVINEGSFNVYISNDSVHQVVVEAESNIIPYIRTIVNGNSLIIDTKKNIKANYPINIYVKSPLVKHVSLEGSGLIQFETLTGRGFKAEINGSGEIEGKLLFDTVEALIDGSGNISLQTDCNKISTEINGSGNINLLGSADMGIHSIDGSGNISALEFVTVDCNADISGSGNMNLNVSDHFDVTVSGSGSVYYIGTPQINVKITGSGSVIKL